MNGTRDSGARGASLVEVLAVAAVIAVVGLMTVASVVAVVSAYRRDAAVRTVLSEIREAQSLAIARNDVIGFHWGADPSVGYSASLFRIVRDTTGSCGFPAPTDPADGTDVIKSWTDLRVDHADVTIQSIKDSGGQNLAGVMFDRIGASVNTCMTVSFPVRVTLVDSTGVSRVIEIDLSGSTRLL